MARISIDQIAQELASDNWKILSTEYKNLDTELHFVCAEGHDVFAPWKKIRTRRECPVCKQNRFKENKPVKIERKKGQVRILALDQATHITGYAIFDDGQLINYGTFQTQNADEAGRAHELSQWFISQCENLQPDVVGIEGIQYQQQVGVTTFQALARLQGVLIEDCICLGIGYKICPTNTWRNHCGVKGRTREDKKRSMQLLTKEWFDITVTDDCADAIGIGKYVSSIYIPQQTIVSWE